MQLGVACTVASQLPISNLRSDGWVSQVSVHEMSRNKSRARETHVIRDYADFVLRLNVGMKWLSACVAPALPRLIC